MTPAQYAKPDTALLASSKVHTAPAAEKATTSLDQANDEHMEGNQQQLQQRRDDVGTQEEESRDPIALEQGVRVVVRVRPLLPEEIQEPQAPEPSASSSWDSSALRSFFGASKKSKPAKHTTTLLRIEPAAASHHDREQGKNTPTVVKVELKSNARRKTEHAFSFDHVLDQHASQSDVFHAARVPGMVRAVLQGYHGCIFAYGQTGSGKTYTMDGVNYLLAGGETAQETKQQQLQRPVRVRSLCEPPTDQAGIALRAINHLFDLIHAENKKQATVADDRDSVSPNAMTPAASTPAAAAAIQYVVHCSFLQIYQEQVFDLLASSLPVRQPNGGYKGSLRVRWSLQKEFYVENLFKHECSDARTAIGHFLSGLKSRLVAAHKLNASSSRSHSIFTLYVQRQDLRHPDQSRLSKLTVVDLAGSERVSLTGAAGQVLRQSIGINKSLFVLRKVIKALAPQSQATMDGGSKRGRSSSRQALPRQHIPYRDSVLTRLLKHSLGGNCVTVMIACLCPSDAYVDENVSTLNYAGMTKTICNRATVNEDPKTSLIRRLRAEIRRLKLMLSRARRQVFVMGDVSTSAAMQRNQKLGMKRGNGSRKETKETEEQVASTMLDSAFPASPPKPDVATPIVLYGYGDTESLQERFVESVAVIKDLMCDNAELRESCEKSSMEAEDATFAEQGLQVENSELRERIAFLEAVILEGGPLPMHGSTDDAFGAPHGSADGESGQGVQQADGDANDGPYVEDLKQMLNKMQDENRRLKEIVVTSEFDLRKAEQERAAALADAQRQIEEQKQLLKQRSRSAQVNRGRGSGRRNGRRPHPVAAPSSYSSTTMAGGGVFFRQSAGDGNETQPTKSRLARWLAMLNDSRWANEVNQLEKGKSLLVASNRMQPLSPLSSAPSAHTEVPPIAHGQVLNNGPGLPMPFSVDSRSDDVAGSSSWSADAMLEHVAMNKTSQSTSRRRPRNQQPLQRHPLVAGSPRGPVSGRNRKGHPYAAHQRVHSNSMDQQHGRRGDGSGRSRRSYRAVRDHHQHRGNAGRGRGRAKTKLKRVGDMLKLDESESAMAQFDDSINSLLARHDNTQTLRDLESRLGGVDTDSLASHSVDEVPHGGGMLPSGRMHVLHGKGHGDTERHHEETAGTLMQLFQARAQASAL